jgi:uncharacterized protein YukJ
LFGDSELEIYWEKLKNVNEEFDRRELNDMIHSYMERAQLKPSELSFNPQFEPEIGIIDVPDVAV